MADAFENILGQPQVREFLRATVASGRVSHAYLFCGPAGSNKTLAALAFAQGILCPKGPKGPRGGNCGACDTCGRIMRKKPADVVLILLARTRESVLPTIVSRCQVVPFRTIPVSEAAGIVVQNSGASLEQARVALQACDGSITRAVEFLKSNERLEFRARVLEVLACLRRADDWDVIGFAADLVVRVKLPLDTVRAEQEAELAENADFLAKSAIRQIEARNKRQLTAKTAESLRQLTGITRSWLRDIMVQAAGASDQVVNADVRPSIEEAAARTDAARAAAAIAAVRRCDVAISYNVSPETCIDAMLLEVRDILYGRALPNAAPRAYAR